MSDDRLAEHVRSLLRQNGRSRPFSRGEVLIVEGDTSDEVLLIEFGKVKVVLHGANGQDSILGFYGPGELMGELGVMGQRPRSADVIARTTGSAVHIDAVTFRALVRRSPVVTTYVNEVLQQRLFHADQRQRLAVSFDVSVRVAKQLLSWARSSGEPTACGGLRVRGLTQLEIAQYVTASAKTLDFVLKQLRADGLVITGRRTYLLPDPRVLERCLDDPNWRPGRAAQDPAALSRLSGRPGPCRPPDSTQAC
jgi:CRP/FNR family transcriptional regulator, cyclic AMP receptor protein